MTIAALMLLALAPAPSAGVALQSRVTIGGPLMSCVTARIDQPRPRGNLLIVPTEFRLAGTIGSCGCMSARAAYVSKANIGGAWQELQRGTLVLKASGLQSVVLASNVRLVAKRVIHVTLACAPPA